MDHRTALVTPMWLNEPDYAARCRKWARHHRQLVAAMGWDLVVLDNASVDTLPLEYGIHARGLRFPIEYRRRGLLDYPHAWRAFYALGPILDLFEYERIIFCENDFFVLSQRLLGWAGTARGLVPLWTEKYQLPESGFFVLTADALPGYRAFCAEEMWFARAGKIFEQIVPWTHVERGFYGDRFEDRPPLATPGTVLDFAAQVRLEDEL